jgi:hypothetical protein
MSTIPQQLQELQALSPAELARRYEALFGKPPRVRNKAWLFRQCAFRLQELAFGGLGDRARNRLDELKTQITLPVAAATPRPRPAPVRAEAKAPLVGTVLMREWRGQQIQVEVRENGFEWSGVVYRSLSACAKAITGAAWNGKLFFGLTSRRSAS